MNRAIDITTGDAFGREPADGASLDVEYEPDPTGHTHDRGAPDRAGRDHDDEGRTGT